MRWNSPKQRNARRGAVARHSYTLAVVAALAMDGAAASCPVPGPNPPSDGTEGSIVVRDIVIDNGDIFDTDNPRHDHFVHRLMNALHIQTDETVIRRQLLFDEGDSISVDDATETERYLRKNRYLANAEVTFVNCEDGVADVQVSTEDTWSLVPSISFSRKGGQNFGGFEIQDTNLLGTGSDVKVAWDSGIDRDQLGVRYADRQIGSSRTGIFLAAEDNSDGERYELNLLQPFYSLDTHRAGGMHLLTFDQLDPITEFGERVGDIRHETRRFEGFVGRSAGPRGRHVIRWTAGFGFDEHTFELVDTSGHALTPPDDRRDVYPFVGLEWFENRFEEMQNLNQMWRVEDRHMGARIALRLGYAPEFLGSMQNALRLNFAAGHSFHPAPQDTVLLRSSFELRQPDSGRASHRIEADGRYYHRQAENRVFFAQLALAAARNPDTDVQLFLGAESGLRGYPLRYQTGDASARVTVEQRYFTDWYPFGLFRVGAAAFADVGRVWGGDGPEAADRRLLADVGLGLRIGSPHSSSGRMLHMDLAYAMEGPPDVRGWQLFIESSTSF